MPKMTHSVAQSNSAFARAASLAKLVLALGPPPCPLVRLIAILCCVEFTRCGFIFIYVCCWCEWLTVIVELRQSGLGLYICYKSTVCNCINIGDIFTKWPDRIKSLGCYIRFGRIEVDSSSTVEEFYGAFNNILNVLSSGRDEMLAGHFVKTYCLPSLLYSCKIWRSNNTDARSIDVAWNNVFRKELMVTGMRVWSCCNSTVNVCLFLCHPTRGRSCFGEKCFIIAMLYCTFLQLNC